MASNRSSTTRLYWLDGARLAAAFCIIALHSSADHLGQAFGNASPTERVFPVMLRTVAEIASTEYFIIVSLFLLAVRFSHRDVCYADNIKQQIRRLLVPFFFWTVFYAFFRFYKAHYFNYTEDLWAEVSQWQSWAHYLTIGSANYHMHFLPTLFVLALFYPIYQIAIKAPIVGLSVIPLIYLNGLFGDFIWSTFENPGAIESLMRVAKLLTYTGYGFAAYALYGIWLSALDKKTTKSLLGFTLLALTVGFAIKLIHASEVIQTGDFGVKRGAIYLGHFLFPCFMVLAFMSCHHFRWPKQLSMWSKYSFGMYLLHPIFLYLLEAATHNRQLTPTTLVMMKFSFAATMSLCASVAISRIPWLAWTIGLGKIPLLEKSTTSNSSKPATA